MPLFKRKPKDEEPLDPNERSEQLGVKHKDLLVMGQLMQQGADLTKPRHALYYLYFADRVSAMAGAEEARAAAYTCEVRDPLSEQPDQWSLVCERSDAVLDPGGVIAADNLFQDIADRLEGEFDGWEAAATP